MTPPLTQIGTDPLAKRLRRSHGEKIAQVRKLRGMSRDALADAVDVTAAAVGMWERGETSPRPHMQLLVARVLDVPHSTLFPMEVA